jgi:hypothetical protein
LRSGRAGLVATTHLRPALSRIRGIHAFGVTALAKAAYVVTVVVFTFYFEFCRSQLSWVFTTHKRLHKNFAFGLFDGVPTR